MRGGRFLVDVYYEWMSLGGIGGRTLVGVNLHQINVLAESLDQLPALAQARAAFEQQGGGALRLEYGLQRHRHPPVFFDRIFRQTFRLGRLTENDPPIFYGMRQPVHS